MGRKRWVGASAGTALLAVVVTGGFGGFGSGASSAGAKQPQVEPTQTVGPVTSSRMRLAIGAPAVLFNGGMGPSCIGGGAFSIPAMRTMSFGGSGPAHFSVAAVASEARVVPDNVSTGTTSVSAPLNDQTGAARALAMAYSSLVAYENMPGDANAAGGAQLIDKAKAQYRTAHAAYEAKRYEDATEQAFASSGASRAAVLARQAEQKPNAIEGLTPPPALVDEEADDRALCALHQAYDSIGAALEAQSQAGADGAFFVNTASASYKQALSEYHAGEFAQAEARAGSAAAAASVVLQLGGIVPTRENLPDVPAPPEQPATP